MDETQLIREIAVKNMDTDTFAQLAISDDHLRDAMIRLMMTHPHIMVYYHCFYAINRASQERPELFYSYWHDVASLMRHRNSYHRDFALTIIANLTKVDRRDLFSTIFRDYFGHINDDKFMTGQCCVQNSLQILKHKPELTDQVIALLLDVDNQCTFSEKQKGLLRCDVLEVLDGVYAQANDKDGVNGFIRTSVGSISPKTRRKARELVAKYGL
jgi:hypothetical protein